MKNRGVNTRTHVYGICFVLDYSVSPVPIADISFSPDPNWLGSSDSVLLITKHLEDEKRFEIGMVKNTGNNARMSYGSIGTLYIVTEDNILGRPISEEIIIDIIDIKVISADETVLPVSARNNSTIVTGVKDNILDNYYEFFPNPASQFIKISTPKGGYPIEAIGLFNISGSKIIEVLETNVIDISNLPTGLYMLEVKSKKGVGYYKVVKN